MEMHQNIEMCRDMEKSQNIKRHQVLSMVLSLLVSVMSLVLVSISFCLFPVSSPVIRVWRGVRIWKALRLKVTPHEKAFEFGNVSGYGKASEYRNASGYGEVSVRIWKGVRI